MASGAPQTILIVGCGVFGLSTALTLADRPSFSGSTVTLIESNPTLPNPDAASVDSSRILRTDYGSSVYAALANEAQKRWRNTSAPDGWGADGRYHESGFAMISNEGKGLPYVKRCLENIRKLKEQGIEGIGKLEVLESKEAVRKITGGTLPGDWGYVNWGSGWANAEKTVRWAIERLREKGVMIQAGAEVTRLVMEYSSDTSRFSVKGVELASGQKLYADLVVLSIGPWTNRLIDLRGRTEATGQPLTYIDLSKAEEEKLSKAPVTMSMATGIYAIPQLDGTLKLGRNSWGYRNPVPVQYPSLEQAEDSKDEPIQVSLPRLNISTPMEAQDDIRTAIEASDLRGKPFSFTKVCWYTDTQEGNFLFDYHPDYDKTLFLATGGSGHGFKFFPIIGEKIADAIEGKLEPSLKELWTYPPETVDKFVWERRPDGSRGGRMGMKLDEELERTSAKL